MSILGKPTDQDLDQYPHVLLTTTHAWDPSVLDYSHPNTHGYPSWAPDPSVRDQHDQRIDRIPSTTPGAEPPRDARDSGSARSHSTHLETSSSNRP